MSLPFNKVPPPPPAVNDIGLDPAWHGWFRKLDNGLSLLKSGNLFTGGNSFKLPASITSPDYNLLAVRDTTGLSGGTPGFFSSAFAAVNTVGAGIGNTEIGVYGRVYVSGNQGHAIYGQAFKIGATSWAIAGTFSVLQDTDATTGTQKGLSILMTSGGLGGSGTRFGAVFDFANRSGGVAPTFDYGQVFRGDGAAQLIQGIAVNIPCTVSCFSLGNAATVPTLIDISAAGNVGSVLSVASTNTVYTTAVLGAYLGKVKVTVSGTTYYLPIYN